MAAQLTLFRLDGSPRGLDEIRAEVPEGALMLNGAPDPLTHPKLPDVLASLSNSRVCIRTTAIA